MQYIYHGVPENMQGKLLKPLNQMQADNPDLHKKYKKKYDDRKEILERRIPLLDCFWNDVVQFLPLHPRKIFELQATMGLIPQVPNYKFFEVNLESLDPAKTVVFFKRQTGRRKRGF